MEAAPTTRRASGRGVLVTGGASGIGLATAARLVERGDRVLLWDLQGERLADVARELDVPFAVVDVANAEQVAAHMFEASRQLGGLDAVVHSAGILRTGLFEQLTLAEQLLTIEVNLGGTVSIAYAALPHLRESRGSLLLLGSASAFYGPPEFATYGATKAAVVGLAQALRIELHGTGVHVGVCNPLFVGTPMVTSQSHEARFVRSQGMAHTADDVARALVRALDRRPFMIWPGGAPRRLWLLTRHLHMLANLLMGWNWRRAARERDMHTPDLTSAIPAPPTAGDHSRE